MGTASAAQTRRRRFTAFTASAAQTRRRRFTAFTAQSLLRRRRNAEQSRTQPWISFTGRMVRIFPKAWKGSVPALRIELFGKAHQGMCMDTPVGISANMIPNSNMQAATHDKTHTNAQYGRL